MPLAFGSLIGGTITQIGTSPNMLISAVRQEIGRPFTCSISPPVGLPLTWSRSSSSASAGGCCRQTGAASRQRKAFRRRGLYQRGVLPEDSPLVGKTVAISRPRKRSDSDSDHP